MLRRINWVLLLILFLALVLRLVGIQHTFPFIFHPDEPSVIRSALAIRFDPNPRHFDWPHLYFYLNFVLYTVFIKIRALLQLIGVQPFLQSYFPILWRDPLVFYFISRVFSATLGAVTLIPLYLTGKRLYNPAAGLSIALVMAFIPLHVWNSHFALIDVPCAFFVAWVCYFSALIYKNKLTKFYLLAGLFVGFAASTKYHGALSAISIVLAHLLVLFESKPKLYDWRSYKNLVLAGIMSLVGFLVGTPYALFDFKTFSRTDGPVGAFWQFSNVGSVDTVTHLKQFIETYLFQLSENVGYTFLFVFVVTIVFMTYKLIYSRGKSLDAIWIYLLPVFVISFYLAGFKLNRSHYYILIFPYLSVVVGYVVSELYIRFKDLSKVRTAIVLLVLFLPPIYLSLKSSYVLSRGDTRNMLYTWMLENVKNDDILVYNSSSFVPVLEKFKYNEHTKRTELLGSPDLHGYLLLNVTEEEPPLISQSNINFVTMFSSYNRMGDNIFVYEINP